MRSRIWMTATGVLAAGLLIGPIQGAEPAPVREAAEYAKVNEKSRELVSSIRENHQIPGMSAGVAIDGKVVWSEGFGYADLEQMVRATAEHCSRIGEHGVLGGWFANGGGDLGGGGPPVFSPGAKAGRWHAETLFRGSGAVCENDPWWGGEFA